MPAHRQPLCPFDSSTQSKTGPPLLPSPRDLDSDREVKGQSPGVIRLGPATSPSRTGGSTCDTRTPKLSESIRTVSRPARQRASRSRSGSSGKGRSLTAANQPFSSTARQRSRSTKVKRRLAADSWLAPNV